MKKEIEPEDTTRAAAYALWMKAPNPMVTFFKTPVSGHHAASAAVICFHDRADHEESMIGFH